MLSFTERSKILCSMIESEEIDWKKTSSELFSNRIMNTDTFMLVCHVDDVDRCHIFANQIAEMNRRYHENESSDYIICKNITRSIRDLNSCMNWFDRKSIREKKCGIILVTPYTLLHPEEKYYWSYSEIVGKVRDIN